MTPSNRCRAQSRGFTLVELMVVVVMVGVLAAIGISLFRQHIYTAKTTQAVAVIQAIRAAQVRYHSEHQAYLNVSSSLTSYYPMATPSKVSYAWDNPSGNDAANWRRLNVAGVSQVQVGFAVVAGGPSADLPAPSTANDPAWPTPIEPWYVIQAEADTDGDGEEALYVASSFNGEIYSENVGE